MLTQLDQNGALITACDDQITTVAEPFARQIGHVQTIIGVGRRSYRPESDAGPHDRRIGLRPC